MNKKYRFGLKRDQLIAILALITLLVVATACNRVNELVAGFVPAVTETTDQTTVEAEQENVVAQTTPEPAEQIQEASDSGQAQAVVDGDEQQSQSAPEPAAEESTAQDAVQEPLRSTPEQPAPVTPAATPTSTATPVAGALTIWHSLAQGSGDALEAILQDFVQKHPDAAFETLFVSQDDLLQSYAQAVAEGGGPDVVLAPNWWLNDLVTLGVIAPIADQRFDNAVNAVWPAALDNLRIGAQLYGIPTTYETVALYYNKSLVPTNQLPSSLDELASMGSRDPRQGVGLYASPFHLAWGFPAFGAQIFDPNGRAVIDESTGASEFLEWLVQIDDTEGSFVDSDYGMLLERFKQGEYAFFIDGPWALRDLSDALGDNLGVAVIPAGPAGDARPWLYSDAVYVNPNLRENQLELAAVFIEHLTNARSGAHIAANSRQLPANRSTDLSADVLLSGFAGQAYNSVGMKHGPEMDAFWRYGGDMILKARAGDMDPQAIVAETAALINDTTGK